MEPQSSQSRVSLKLEFDHLASVGLEGVSEGLKLARYLGLYAMRQQGRESNKVVVAQDLQIQLLEQMDERIETDGAFSFNIDYGVGATEWSIDFTSGVLRSAVKEASANGEDIQVVEQRRMAG